VKTDTDTSSKGSDTIVAPPAAVATAPASQANALDIFDVDPVAASEKGADVELVHPASQFGLGHFVNIIGSESAEMRAFAKTKVSEQTRKNFARQRGRRPDPDQIAKETVDKLFDRSSSVELALVACKGWWRYANPEAEVLDKDGKVKFDATEEEVLEAKGRINTWLFEGQEIPFTPDNAKRVFTARPWIATQIDAGTQALENFFTS
jgi:hypothetical protein